MYFVRLQIAHVLEALYIIQDMNQDASLLSAVSACDVRTQRSFAEVSGLLGTDDYKKMLRLRNNVTFHYGDKVVANAVAASLAKNPDEPLQISLVEETIDWYFAPADRIIDHIVVRDIFAVPAGADVRSEVDAIIVRLQEIMKKFCDFAGYFIWHHVKCL